jgi:hypothetical protein
VGCGLWVGLWEDVVALLLLRIVAMCCRANNGMNELRFSAIT